MKKLAYSLVCALILVSMSRSDVFAQEIQKGNFILSPGIGFGYHFWGGVTIGINGEYAFSDEISGGGYFAYSHLSDNFYGYSSDIAYNFVDFGVRASYHFAKLLRVPNKKFDPYAGAQVGGAVGSNNYHDVNGYRYNAYDGGVRGGLYAGARWYFNDRVGVYGEVGFALCPVMVGATFKF
ncbi:MAG: hypothetical protein ABIS36_13100 [Chryseolinea sp.]